MLSSRAAVAADEDIRAVGGQMRPVASPMAERRAEMTMRCVFANSQRHSCARNPNSDGWVLHKLLHLGRQPGNIRPGIVHTLRIERAAASADNPRQAASLASKSHRGEMGSPSARWAPRAGNDNTGRGDGKSPNVFKTAEKRSCPRP